MNTPINQVSRANQAQDQFAVLVSGYTGASAEDTAAPPSYREQLQAIEDAEQARWLAENAARPRRAATWGERLTVLLLVAVFVGGLATLPEWGPALVSWALWR